MSSIPQRLYNEIMMADNFTCVYCGKRTPDVEVDHIIPQLHGGPDVLHNLVAACPTCNRRKRDHQLHEVGMRLRFGRYDGRASYPRKHRMIAPEELPVLPPALRPKLTNSEYLAHIRDLAIERTEDGKYRFSANKIRDIVGGNDAFVKAQVKSFRMPS